MLGVERYSVKLVPHDESWAEEFQKTKAELEEILGDNVIEIQHVGSTAISGIMAKPILDVAVVVKSIENLNFIGWSRQVMNIRAIDRTRASISLSAVSQVKFPHIM